MHDSRSWAAYFRPREDSTAEDESHEERKQLWRYAERLEMIHIADIAGEE
jgi:hypothetical protein